MIPAGPLLSMLLTRGVSHAGPPMQGGGRGRGRRGGYPEPSRMDGNGLAFGFDAGTFRMPL